MTPALRASLGLGLAVLFGYFAYQSIGVVRADAALAEGTLASLARAATCAPDNAAAAMLIAANDADLTDEVRRAVALNPLDASAWTALAAIDEQAGDLAAAEADLKSAVGASRYYEPAWSLAAFYYRQKRRADFLPAARRTLDIGAGDMLSILAMAAKLGVSDEEISRTLLPNRDDVLDSYIQLSLAEKRWSGVVGGASRFVAVAPQSRQRVLEGAVRGLLEGQRPVEAAAAWNLGVEKGWFPKPLLGDASHEYSANPTFVYPFVNSGLDWGYDPVNDVGIADSPKGGVSVELGGREPADAVLLFKRLALTGPRSYELRVVYRTKGIRSGSGLFFALEGGGGSVTEFASLSSDETVEKSFPFQAAAGASAPRLVLRYRRPLGTVRIEGKLWLDSVRVVAAMEGAKR